MTRLSDWQTGLDASIKIEGSLLGCRSARCCGPSGRVLLIRILGLRNVQALQAPLKAEGACSLRCTLKISFHVGRCIAKA